MVSIRIRRKDVVKATAAFLILMVLALMAAVRPAYAATIQVNTTDDEFGTGAGCSLREAIQAANTDAAFGGCEAGAAGSDTIVLTTGIYTLTIDGAGEDLNATGDLDIRDAVIIRGNDSTIQACDQERDSTPPINLNSACPGNGIEERVFHVVNPSLAGDIILRDMVIERGRSGRGGGVLMSPIPSGRDVQLTGVTIRENYGGQGGGLAAQGDGRIQFFTGTITQNEAGDGGAFWNIGASRLEIRQSTVSGNFTTSGTGIGGLRVSTNFGSAALVMSESTISGNDNGGVYYRAEANDPQGLNIQRSTIAGNTGFGLAIQLLDPPDEEFPTVSRIDKTLVVGNDTDDCVFPDGLAFIGANNLSTAGDMTCTDASFVGSIDLTTDINTTLADNGGPTQTHALLYDLENPALDTAGTCGPALDQRRDGFPRNVDLVGIGNEGSDFCDIGAFELGVFTVAAAAVPTNPTEGTTSTVTLTLASVPGAEVTFDLSTSDSSECTVPGSVATTTGTATFDVTAVDDNLDDGDQSCTVFVNSSLSADTNWNLLFALANVELIIVDNDSPDDDDDGGDEDEDDGEDAPEAVASGPVVDEGTGLSLDIVAQPSVISGPGDEVVFTVTVTNGSNAAIDPGQLTTTIPEQFSIASATPSQGEAQIVGQQVFLQSGEIGAGASVTVTIPTTFNGGAATLPNGAAAQTDSSQFTATATVSGLSDTATVRILPGELPATGGQPVREVPIAAVAAVALALIAGGFALRVRRRTA